MKSYGRAPTFLITTGNEQVRSIVAHLAGDDAAADEVQLVLPETGVCSSSNALSDEQLANGDSPDAACCGTPEGARLQLTTLRLGFATGVPNGRTGDLETAGLPLVEVLESARAPAAGERAPAVCSRAARIHQVRAAAVPWVADRRGPRHCRDGQLGGALLRLRGAPGPDGLGARPDLGPGDGGVLPRGTHDRRGRRLGGPLARRAWPPRPHDGRCARSAGLVAAWSQVRTVWQLYVVLAAIGLVRSTVLYEPAFAVIVRWFHHQRSEALLAVTLVAGFASTVPLPTANALTERSRAGLTSPLTGGNRAAWLRRQTDDDPGHPRGNFESGACCRVRCDGFDHHVCHRRLPEERAGTRLPAAREKVSARSQ